MPSNDFDMEAYRAAPGYDIDPGPIENEALEEALMEWRRELGTDIYDVPGEPIKKSLDPCGQRPDGRFDQRNTCAADGDGVATADDSEIIEAEVVDEVDDSPPLATYKTPKLGPGSMETLKSAAEALGVSVEQLKALANTPDGMGLLHIKEGSGEICSDDIGGESCYEFTVDSNEGSATTDGFTATFVIGRSDEGELRLYNQFAMVPPSLRGQGLGAKAVVKQVLAAKDLGIERIKLNATRFNARTPKYNLIGYRVWPKMGFDCALPRNIRDELPTDILLSTTASFNKRQARRDNAEKSYMTMQDLYSTKRGRDWWAKHGDSIDMELDIRNLAKGTKAREKFDRFARFLLSRNEVNRKASMSKGLSQSVPEAFEPDLSDAQMRFLDRLWDDPKGRAERIKKNRIQKQLDPCGQQADGKFDAKNTCAAGGDGESSGASSESKDTGTPFKTPAVAIGDKELVAKVADALGCTAEDILALAQTPNGEGELRLSLEEGGSSGSTSDEAREEWEEERDSWASDNWTEFVDEVAVSERQLEDAAESVDADDDWQREAFVEWATENGFTTESAEAAYGGAQDIDDSLLVLDDEQGEDESDEDYQTRTSDAYNSRMWERTYDDARNDRIDSELESIRDNEGTPDWAVDAALDAAREDYESNHPMPEDEPEVDSDGPLELQFEINPNVRPTDPNFKYTATFELIKNSDGELELHNSYALVHPSYRAMGSGLEGVVRQIEAGKKIGCKKLSCQAARYDGYSGEKEWMNLIGYKFWPRMGMDGEVTVPKDQLDKAPAEVQHLFTRNASGDGVGNIREMMQNKVMAKIWEEKGGSVDVSLILDDPEDAGWKQFSRLSKRVLRSERAAEPAVAKSIRKRKVAMSDATGPLGFEPSLTPAQMAAFEAAWDELYAEREKHKAAKQIHKAAKYGIEKGLHQYGSTQFDLPLVEADMVRQLAASIPDEWIAEAGREDQPHITIKYGLDALVDAQDVADVLRGQNPVRVQLGATGCFYADDSDTQRRGDGFDVVYVTVHPVERVAGLMGLNALLTENLPTVTTHPNYTPHITLAYVKAGYGQQLVGHRALEGLELVVDSVTFSDPAGRVTRIPLVNDDWGGAAGTPTEPEPSDAAALLMQMSQAESVEEAQALALDIAKKYTTGGIKKELNPCGQKSDGEFDSENICATGAPSKVRSDKLRAAYREQNADKAVSRFEQRQAAQGGVASDDDGEDVVDEDEAAPAGPVNGNSAAPGKNGDTVDVDTDDDAGTAPEQPTAEQKVAAVEPSGDGDAAAPAPSDEDVAAPETSNAAGEAAPDVAPGDHAGSPLSKMTLDEFKGHLETVKNMPVDEQNAYWTSLFVDSTDAEFAEYMQKVDELSEAPLKTMKAGLFSTDDTARAAAMEAYQKLDAEDKAELVRAMSDDEYTQLSRAFNEAAISQWHADAAAGRHEVPQISPENGYEPTLPPPALASQAGAAPTQRMVDGELLTLVDGKWVNSKGQYDPNDPANKSSERNYISASNPPADGPFAAPVDPTDPFAGATIKHPDQVKREQKEAEKAAKEAAAERKKQEKEDAAQLDKDAKAKAKEDAAAERERIKTENAEKREAMREQSRAHREAATGSTVDTAGGATQAAGGAVDAAIRGFRGGLGLTPAQERAAHRNMQSANAPIKNKPSALGQPSAKAPAIGSAPGGKIPTTPAPTNKADLLPKPSAASEGLRSLAGGGSKGGQGYYSPGTINTHGQEPNESVASVGGKEIDMDNASPTEYRAISGDLPAPTPRGSVIDESCDAIAQDYLGMSILGESAGEFRAVSVDDVHEAIIAAYREGLGGSGGTLDTRVIDEIATRIAMQHLAIAGNAADEVDVNGEGLRNAISVAVQAGIQDSYKGGKSFKGGIRKRKPDEPAKENCGNGAGGFKQANKCAAGKGDGESGGGGKQGGGPSPDAPNKPKDGGDKPSPKHVSVDESGNVKLTKPKNPQEAEALLQELGDAHAQAVKETREAFSKYSETSPERAAALKKQNAIASKLEEATAWAKAEGIKHAEAEAAKPKVPKNSHKVHAGGEPVEPKLATSVLRAVGIKAKDEGGKLRMSPVKFTDVSDKLLSDGWHYEGVENTADQSRAYAFAKGDQRLSLKDIGSKAGGEVVLTGKHPVKKSLGLSLTVMRHMIRKDCQHGKRKASR